RECIQYLRDACKEIGFDDAYIICSRSSESEVYTERIGADGMYNYSYAISEITGGAQEANLEKTKGMYDNSFLMPAITQGREESAWLRNKGKFMSVEDFKSALEYARDDFYKDYDKYPVSEKLVMIDTWNEYGEGHLVAPCNLAGFGYLDAVRDVFTDGGSHEDDLPTDEQKADYGILYPDDRAPLKIGENMTVPIPDTVYRSFSGSDFELWEKDKQIQNGRVENGLLKGEAIGIDPSVISPAGLNIDLQDITYVHVRMNQISGSKSTTLYFITEDDQKWNEAKGLTFSPDVEGGMSDVYFPMWQKSTWTGKLTQFRIDPLNALGSFEIESIEFLKSSPGDFVNIVLDGDKVPLSSLQSTSAAVKVQSLPMVYSNKIYLPMKCYSAYFNVKAIYIPDEHKIRLIHDIYHLDIDIETGAATLNGTPCEPVPFILEGNQYFTAARESLERLGYKIDWDGETNAMLVTTPPPAPSVQKETEPFGQWNFNFDDDLQGWSASRTISMATVSDGVLMVEAATADPALTLSKLSFDASKYTTLRFAIKNGTKSNLTQIFFTTDKDSTLNEAKSYKVTVDTMTDDFIEYEVDLTSNSAWTGTVTSLRFDPAAAAGDIGIDYIVLSND
ncbi:MAG: glycoside hydrolase family 99-like domain-containing protein, partial [Clostridia bacterium]|nr:glycoside hydrolase family 99-like domain-containing protein [Clostridia bacterium]